MSPSKSRIKEAIAFKSKKSLVLMVQIVVSIDSWFWILLQTAVNVGILDNKGWF